MKGEIQAMEFAAVLLVHVCAAERGTYAAQILVIDNVRALLCDSTDRIAANRKLAALAR